MQYDRVVANRSQRAIRQTHLAALDLDTRLRSGLSNIRRADGAEELALGSRFGGNQELELLERCSTLFSRREMLTGSLLELCSTSLETLDVIGSGSRGLALRQQEVAAETGPDFDPIADV